jgi:hypothetical protein
LSQRPSNVRPQIARCLGDLNKPLTPLGKPICDDGARQDCSEPGGGNIKSSKKVLASQAQIPGNNFDRVLDKYAAYLVYAFSITPQTVSAMRSWPCGERWIESTVAWSAVRTRMKMRLGIKSA